MGDARNYTEPNLAIIERCKSGDRTAFQELYGLYAKAMFNISLRILNNRSEAEEVLQDSFLKVFSKIDTYDKAFAFGAWLKRIVINGSLDVLKKKKVNFVALDEARYDQDEGAEEDDSVYETEILKKCISELPDGFRTVLTLFVFEEQSHKEIAALLNISEGTSKSQYNRAKKKLVELVKLKTVNHER
jgi:RNA polymerase sigma factor (sigma-70 family)